MKNDYSEHVKELQNILLNLYSTLRYLDTYIHYSNDPKLTTGKEVQQLIIKRDKLKKELNELIEKKKNINNLIIEEWINHNKNILELKITELNKKKKRSSDKRSILYSIEQCKKIIEEWNKLREKNLFSINLAGYNELHIKDFTG